MDTALVWFRRDLRLADNPALRTALERHRVVLPVYVHDPDAEAPWAAGAASRWWLHQALESLSASLAGRGGRLLIRRGRTLEVLRALAAETGAGAVYWNRLYEPAFVERDHHVKTALRGAGLQAESFNAALLFEPWEIRTAAREPYRVFTPYWRQLAARLQSAVQSGHRPLAVPARMPATPPLPASLALAELSLLPTRRWDAGLQVHWQPGEAAAQRTLQRLVAERIDTYGSLRDRPAAEITSELSADLHFGTLSPLQIVNALHRAAEARPSAGLRAEIDGYLRQLAWREFAHQLLFHFPRTAEASLDERFAAFPWRPLRAYAADLVAWQRGRTGVPIIDAGMRQLWHTGWMHNRVRMLVASFLTKNLLIPWQEGARWFWDTLVDADLANNTLGWQWCAGCGADAAPFFRIFNPVVQGARFDREGDYVRRWVPELAGLPANAIHAPWTLPAAALRQVGVVLGQSYPQPVTDLSVSRKQALAAYQTIR